MTVCASPLQSTKPVWKKPPAIEDVLNVELAEMFKLVAAKVSKKPFVLVTEVPVAEVKPNAPDRVPPVSNK